jgi:hypothetical protein
MQSYSKRLRAIWILFTYSKGRNVYPRHQEHSCTRSIQRPIKWVNETLSSGSKTKELKSNNSSEPRTDNRDILPPPHYALSSFGA